MTHTPEDIGAKALEYFNREYTFNSKCWMTPDDIAGISINSFQAGHTQGWVEALEYCLDLFVNKHLNWEGMRNAIDSKLQEAASLSAEEVK